MLEIKGIEKSDIINYDPYTTITIFLGRCNFLCPFCQNPDLIRNADKIPSINEEEIFSLLEKRKEWYDGICVTGGEPTLHEGLLSFLAKIKKRKLLVKLDTNGYNPAMLEKLIKQKLVDYIAMDIKTELKKYDQITGIKTNVDLIKRSVTLIINSNLNYEFRTTVLPKFHKTEELLEIAKSLNGAKKYCLQQFNNRVNMMDESMKKENPYTLEELNLFKEMLAPYFEEIIVKNT